MRIHHCAVCGKDNSDEEAIREHLHVVHEEVQDFGDMQTELVTPFLFFRINVATRKPLYGVRDREAVEVFNQNYYPRGIGSNWIKCFVCNGIPEGAALNEDRLTYKGRCQQDMAAFTGDEENARKIARWFMNARGCSTHLTWNDGPAGIKTRFQLKVGACDSHQANLRRLHDAALAFGGINESIISYAVGDELTELEKLHGKGRWS